MKKSSLPKLLNQWDLLLTGFGAFLLSLLIFLTPSVLWLNPFRMIIGLPLILFIPGYWCLTALFPTREDFVGFERFSLSFGLSVTWTSFLALILDQSSKGIQIQSVFVYELIFIFIFMTITYFRRKRLAPSILYFPEFVQRGTWWKSKSKISKLRDIFLGIIFGVAIIVIIWDFLTPPPSNFMTAFYILNPDGLAESYPKHAVKGEEIFLTVGLTNNENKNHTYSVFVLAVDTSQGDRWEKIGEVTQISLEVDQTKEIPIKLSMPWVGDDQSIEFLLFIDDLPEPYRKLHLQLNVVEGN